MIPSVGVVRLDTGPLVAMMDRRDAGKGFGTTSAKG